jgi:hypothetical protein
VIPVTFPKGSALQSTQPTTGAPMSATKFREYAAEHLDWAKTATSDRERQMFEQMAEAWLKAAALRDEDRTGCPSESPLDE